MKAISDSYLTGDLDLSYDLWSEMTAEIHTAQLNGRFTSITFSLYITGYVLIIVTRYVPNRVILCFK